MGDVLGFAAFSAPLFKNERVISEQCGGRRRVAAVQGVMEGINGRCRSPRIWS